MRFRTSRPLQLTVAVPASIEKLEGPPTTPLTSLGVAHGAQLFLRYSVERSVQGPPKSVFESRPFGAHMDVARMVALQTRIERQESPDCPGVSFDGDAIHAFQSYVSAAIAFSIKRGGILYGTGVCDEFFGGGRGGGGASGCLDVYIFFQGEQV